MKSKLFVFLSVSIMTLSSLNFASAFVCDGICIPFIPIPPAPSPTPTPTTTGGGIAFAAFGNGAFFSWDTYVAPVVKISGTGSSTVVATTAGYFTNGDSNSIGKVAGVSKFKFTKDQYTSVSMNKISPDISELQKVLAAEGLLGINSQTGIYDETTKAAVAAFQKKYGIKPAPIYPYGYFGPLTRAFQNAR